MYKEVLEFEEELKEDEIKRIDSIVKKFISSVDVSKLKINKYYEIIDIS